MDAFSLRPDELPDLAIDTLGVPKIESPLPESERGFVADSERVLLYTHSEDLKTSNNSGTEPPMFEMAGPRRNIFFHPEKLTCGIVTCGGLCPGLNDVIRTITLSLLWQYNVKAVYGFRYGYMGLSSNAPKEPVILTPEAVDDIHLQGGDILSSSRGPQESDDMVDTLEKMGIELLFVIGGDGTLRGAHDLNSTIKKRGLKISVIGVPKTIDNDI